MQVHVTEVLLLELHVPLFKHGLEEQLVSVYYKFNRIFFSENDHKFNLRYYLVVLFK